MAKVLLIDNYDSFTFNLYHYLEEIIDDDIEVMRNDAIDFDKALDFENIVISPGPGLPSSTGSLMDLLEKTVKSKKILGICLGQQAIAELFGMRLSNLKQVVHGQKSLITVTSSEDSIFQGIPKQFYVGRYHSWVIDPASLIDDIEVTSLSETGEIMSISHKKNRVKAVQFHPESILTEYGKTLLRNWYFTSR